MSPQARLLASVVAAVAVVVSPAPVGAAAEQPVEAHLVAPEGARIVRGSSTGREGDFVDSIPGLEVHREDGAMGAITRGDLGVIVTAVRLRDEQEAARALAAFRGWGGRDVEILPELAPGTITRRITYTVDGFPGEGTLVEVVRATGRDMVVLAQVDIGQPEVNPLTRDALDAHLVAFPDVTPPLADRRPMPLGLAALGLTAAAAVVAMRVPRGRRRRPPSAATEAPPVIDPGQIRVNW